MKSFHLILSATLSFVILSSTSSGLQLQSYLKSTQEFMLLPQVQNSMYHDGGTGSGSTTEFKQITNLQVAKELTSDYLYVSSNLQNDPEIDEDTLQQTHFLPWVPNHGAFMQLSYADFGNWFFTSQLSGCEIWIAHDRNPNNQPLIIRVNSHDCQNEKEIGEREALGVAALKRYNMNHKRHYELLQRIMVNISGNPVVYTDPDGYLSGLHRRFPHVQITMYDHHAVFYGMHCQPYYCEDDTGAYYGGWKFYLRSTDSLQFYAMRAPTGSLASTICAWLRYHSGEYIGATDADNTLCGYMNTTLREYAQSGLLHLSDSEGILMGSVPTDQTLYVAELFNASYELETPLNEISMETLQYTCSSTELQITTRTQETAIILPGVLELMSASISFHATLSPVGIRFFQFTANWGIGNVNGRFTIEDNLETSQLLLRGSPRGEVSLNLEDEIETLTGKNIPLPVHSSSVSLRDVEVFGAIDTFASGSATFSISGKYGQNNLMHMILQTGVSNLGANYTGAFAAEFTDFAFADLIQELIGADISGAPFLGYLVVPPMAVAAATADVSSSSLLQAFKAGSLLHLSNGYIQEGITAYVHLNAINNAPLKMSYFNSSFLFEVVRGRSFSVRSLLSQVGLNLNTVPVVLPPGISDVFNLDIKQFSISTDSSELFIDANFPNTLSYFDGLLNLQNVVVSVSVLLMAPQSISVDASGHLEIENQVFDVYIEQDTIMANYSVQGGFNSDLRDQAEELIENALQKYLEEATKAIRDAQQEVDEKEAELRTATDNRNRAQQNVNNLQRHYDTNVGKLHKALADLRDACTPPTCHRICIGNFCGSRCVATVWGRCVFWAPTFDSCCSIGPDLICEARRATCRALRSVLATTVNRFESVVGESRAEFEAAENDLENKKSSENNAQFAFDNAVAAHENTLQMYQPRVEAANQIATCDLGGIVDLMEITFDIPLDGGNFAGLVKGCLAGNNTEVDTNISLSNFYDVTSIARQISDHVINGLSSYVI